MIASSSRQAIVVSALALSTSCGLVTSDPGGGSEPGGQGGHPSAGAGGASVGGAGEIDAGVDASNDGSPDGGGGSGGSTVEPCPASTGEMNPLCAASEQVCGCALSCCEQLLVPAGQFLMGRGISGADASDFGDPEELPEHPASVSSFYLDAFEVTVARFRPFVEGYPDTLPAPGAGANPFIPNSGWNTQFEELSVVPKNRVELELMLQKCGGGFVPGVPDPVLPTYTPEPGQFDEFPINCANWYVAFAFCAWEGGRLPTEAEWEYATAGGEENRLYPWGADESAFGSFDWICLAPTCVGKHGTSKGRARWGHFDLAGSMLEWVLDTMAAYASAPCIDCATYDPSDGTNDEPGIIRGASWASPFWRSRSAWRGIEERESLAWTVGFRCARTP